jgi:abortive infection bacteriophage resistance protein
MATLKQPFSKPATTYAQQVALLQQRGMVINDPAAAEFYLQHFNYYRLGAYWLPFEADHATHRFRPGTRFEEVVNLYVFDRELRLLMLDAIERLEVSVRGQWAYQLAHRHGPHAHLDATLFETRYWPDNLKKLTEEVDRSDEVFIRHLKATYAEALPPVWAVCEVMSLGLLSRWYNSLKPMSTRRLIAGPYGVDERVLESWLRHLSLVRNTCAHHSRLWNREFTITPVLPRNKPVGLAAQCQGGSRKLYNTLVILLHCMDVIAPRHSWRLRLRGLLIRPGVSTAAMDFPSGWEQLPIWR